MRLTLRTLLAYLDDTLDPSEAKMIGQKVAESAAAQELVERIKKVTRRRSLANPSVFGEESKLDPNTVAAYLSDALSADEVSEVEQTCLQHDVYLAEVAACHQILTLMLSEPVLIPPTARQRMYRLVKGRESIPYRRPPVFAPAAELHGKLAPEETSRPKTRRLVGYVAAIVALSAMLAASVWFAWPGRRAVPTGNQGERLVAVAPLVIPTKPMKVEATKPDVPKVDPPKTDTPKVDPPKTDTPKTDTPKTDTPKVDVPKVDIPKTNTPKVDPPKNDLPKVVIDRPVVLEPSKSKREIGRLVSPEVVLLQKMTGAKSWTRVVSDARVTASTELIAMPGSRADIKLDTGLVVTLAGNLPEMVEGPHLECGAILYAPAEGFDAEFLLDRGRITVSNPRSKPAAVRMRFASEVWDVTVGEQGEILVDLLQSYPASAAFSKHPGGDRPVTEVFLGALKGRVDLMRKDFPALVMTAPAFIEWNSNRGEVQGPNKLRDLLPVWLPAPANRPVVVEARAAQDEFSRRMAGKEADVEVALTEMEQEAKPASQALGVFGLGAIGDVLSVVDALDEPNRFVARGAAIIALRHWCARKPENDLVLYNILRSKKNYSETHADLVLELLHDFSPAAVQKPQTYQLLLGYLNHDRLSVRTLAFWHLAKLDPGGEKVALYDPDGDDTAREKAIAAWRKRIPPNKMPPRPNP